MRAHFDYSSRVKWFDETAAPRPALAGGSDQGPPEGPHKGPAKIIRFPVERLSPAKDERSGPAADGGAPTSPEASPAGDGALWAAWLSSVLSRGGR